MEGKAGMKLRTRFRMKSVQHGAAWAAAIFAALMLVFFASRTALFGKMLPDKQNPAANAGYVGSRVCAKPPPTPVRFLRRHP